MCRGKTEVYSRVVGFYRPVNGWNAGKKAEFGKRKTFDIETIKREHETGKDD